VLMARSISHRTATTWTGLLLSLRARLNERI
jgi:hypothetical protein